MASHCQPLSAGFYIFVIGYAPHTDTQVRAHRLQSCSCLRLCLNHIKFEVIYADAPAIPYCNTGWGLGTQSMSTMAVAQRYERVNENCTTARNDQQCEWMQAGWHNQHLGCHVNRENKSNKNQWKQARDPRFTVYQDGGNSRRTRSAWRMVAPLSLVLHSSSEAPRNVSVGSLDAALLVGLVVPTRAGCVV